MRDKIKKKAQGLGLLQNVILSLVVIGFILIIGLSLMEKGQETTLEDNGSCFSASCNGSGVVIESINEIPAWLPIIVIAFIALIVLGVIFLLQRRQSN